MLTFILSLLIFEVILVMGMYRIILRIETQLVFMHNHHNNVYDNFNDMLKKIRDN